MVFSFDMVWYGIDMVAGRLAQLVERSSGDREVPGSNPSVSRSSEWALQLW